MTRIEDPTRKPSAANPVPSPAPAAAQIQRRAASRGEPAWSPVEAATAGEGACFGGAINAGIHDRPAGGVELPAPIQEVFASSMGVDVSGVRVHTAAASATAADDVGARAFALGQDIHFASGEYRPDSDEGARVLAHEVVHTVQQRGAAAPAADALTVSAPNDPAEREADRLATALMSGDAAAVIQRPQVQAMYRQVQRWATPTTSRHVEQLIVDARSSGQLSAILAELRRVRDTHAEGVVMNFPGCRNGVVAQEDVPALIAMAERREEGIDMSEPGGAPAQAPAPAPVYGPPEAPVDLAGGTPRLMIGGADPDTEWMSGPPIHGAPSELAVPTFAPPSAVDEPAEQGLRAAGFAELQQQVGDVRAAVAEVRPLIMAYRDTSNDLTLRGFSIPVQAHPLNLSELAMQQPAPLVGGRHRIADLFPADATNRPLSAGETRALTSAAPAVQTQLSAARNAETAIEGKLEEFQGAAHAIAAAGDELDAALSAEAAGRFQRAQGAAQLDVAALTRERDEEKQFVRDVVRAAEAVASLAVGAGGGGGAGMSGSLRSGVTGLQSNALHDLIGSAVDRIVDSAYNDRINDAQAAVDRLGARVEAFLDERVARNLSGLRRRVQQARSALATRRHEMRLLVEARRSAYQELGAAVAAHAPAGAGAHQDAERVRSMIAAIPMVEVVVDRLQQIVGALDRLPSSSHAIRTGAEVVVERQRESLRMLRRTYSLLLGFRVDLAHEHQAWSQRLASLRATLDVLGGSDARHDVR